MVGNISDIKPLMATRQMIFQLNGNFPTVKMTCVGKYTTPSVDMTAATAKSAIIFAGLKYFMRKVATHLQTMKSTIAIV